MLPPDRRLHRSTDFTDVLRTGRRAGRPLLTLHLLDTVAPAGQAGPGSEPRAGLVVSKAVGGSVVRHRTARRLRHLLVPRLSRLPAGSRLVVRAAPGAGAAGSAALAVDLDRALVRLGVPPAAPAGTAR